MFSCHYGSLIPIHRALSGSLVLKELIARDRVRNVLRILRSRDATGPILEGLFDVADRQAACQHVDRRGPRALRCDPRHDRATPSGTAV